LSTRRFLLQVFGAVLGAFSMAGVIIVTQAEPPTVEKRVAPVVEVVAGMEVLVQTGTYEYDPSPTVTVLYCVRDPDKLHLDCVVYVRTSKGNGIAMVTGVAPTEVTS
jgi:hypothetical protein